MSDPAWHESEECRQAIERDRQTLAAYNAERERCLEHDIRLNNWRHEEALKLLEQCIRYVRDNNYYAFEALYWRYQQWDQMRINEKFIIMNLYKINTLTSPHDERAKALKQELRDALATRTGKRQEVTV